MQRSHLLFLITICLAVSCIYTTYYGFFLVMQKFSEISKVNLVDEGNKSWFDQKGKVIMIVVDAFRFDFLTYNETIEGHESYTYQNRLKKMHKLLKTSPESFTVLRARADFPTWTIAKVPGMVTGNIYPKTGMFQAMAASRSIEDNVPKQATLAGKIALFRGDPLWRDYFPEDFKDITSVRGYDIKNSNIDDEIKAEVRAFIKENNFDLLISHLLSLDHTAHSVGLYDEKVGEQLGIVDDWLAEVIDMMDDNTTLIILGDHGMNLLGSHGTDTPEETNTVIAGYHKLGFQKYRDNITSPVMRSINETPLQLKQQDLASTLAMLVGVPIPFSNVGQIINDMYPAGQFEDPPGCEGRAFLTKILNDNYLNTAQIKHYYDFFNEKTELLSAELQKNMTSSAEEAISAYKEAIAMTKNGQQCQESFVDKSTKAILLGQKFSNIVYSAILTNKDYNMAVILQGLASMVLIIICYILQVQHFYSHAYERQYDEFKIDMTLFKSLIIPVLALLGIFLVTFLINGRFVHFLTSATVFLNLWLVINLFVYNFRAGSHGTLQHCTRFLNGAKHEDIKQQELDDIPLDATDKSEREAESQKGDQEADDVFTDIDSQIEQGKRGGFWAGLKSLFIFKTPIVSISALMFTVATVYCLQASIFESFIEDYAKDYSPFVVLLLIGFRISSPFSATIFYLIMAANMIVVVIIAKSDLIDPQSLKLRIIFGLILMADFVVAEIRHIIARMGAHVIWGCGQVLCFLVIAVYQMIDERSIFLVEIVLPRIVWALIICLCVFKNVFLISGRASLRNLQLCLVQFLLLLQGQKDVIPFAMTLTLMRITTYLVSRYSKPSNYLFPFIMVLETYFGFFFLGQTDRTFPATYNAGFVGLHDFNMVLSGPMIVLALLSGFVLGGLFVSYYNQYIQAHYHVGSEAVSDKTNWRITARVIKKRNIVFFVFLVCIVHFGAYLKCLAWRKEFLLLEEARYKYIVDGFIYIVVMGWVALVLAFE